jgi:thiamine-phosphate pyrophosphorylase
VPLIAAGADMVAVISSVYFADDPEGAARKLTSLFGQGVR